MTELIVYTLTGVCGLGLVNAVSLSYWMNILGNGMMFGRKHFHLHWATCVRGCTLALTSLLPFIILMVCLLRPLLDENLQVLLSGYLADESADEVLSGKYAIRLMMWLHPVFSGFSYCLRIYAGFSAQSVPP